MVICEQCRWPKLLHVGYHHSRRRCIVATCFLDLHVFLGPKRGREVWEQVVAWYEAEAARLDCGSGI